MDTGTAIALLGAWLPLSASILSPTGNGMTVLFTTIVGAILTVVIL